MKIYVQVVEKIFKKERKDETHLITKENGFLSFRPPSPLNVNVFFCRFLKISPCVWPNSRFWCYVFVTLRMCLLCSNPFIISISIFHGFHTRKKIKICFPFKVILGNVFQEDEHVKLHFGVAFFHEMSFLKINVSIILSYVFSKKKSYVP